MKALALVLLLATGCAETLVTYSAGTCTIHQRTTLRVATALCDGATGTEVVEHKGISAGFEAVLGALVGAAAGFFVRWRSTPKPPPEVLDVGT